VSKLKVRPIFQRIVSSFIALGSVWLLIALVPAICFRTFYLPGAYLISSIPVFAIAWIVVGIPAIVAGQLMTKMSIWGVALLGAVAGLIVFFTLNREEHFSRLELFGWSASAALAGAAVMILYRLLIETKMKSSPATSDSGCSWTDK
jgi:hypothetical protein